MPTIVRFDCYEVDLAAGQILKRGAKIRLREQCFQVLAALLERPGQVLTRDELRRRLWPDDVFVDFENNLNTAVARLREALNDSAESPRFIETLPRHGYRFTGTLSKETVPTPGPVGMPKPRLLVLPFVNTGDPALEDFSDVIRDELITGLAALAPDALTVIARTTAMHFKGSNLDVAGIGRELNVDHVLKGTVRRSGDAVAVTAQLVRVNDQAELWAQRYEGPPGDLFSIQSAVAQGIAGALDVTPDGRAVEHADAAKKRARDPIAYKEYVQGRRHLDAFRTCEDVEKARVHFERAVARDSDFVLAREALAELYCLQGYLGLMPPGDAFAAGILHAIRALEIDDTRAETHGLLAQYHKQLEYNWPDIEREIRRALDLNPASPFVSWMYVVGWLMPQGRIQDGIEELERAMQRDPLSVWVNTWLGIMLVLAHQWDRVIAHTRVMIELDPDSPWGHWLLGGGFRGKGLPDDAIAAFRRAADLSGGWHFMLGWLGLILGVSGRADEARAVLERLEVMARSAYVPPTSFAWVYLGLRDVDRAFEWLDRAVDAHDQLMMPIKTYAFFDPIRKDPRFAALLRKMKLD